MFDRSVAQQLRCSLVTLVRMLGRNGWPVRHWTAAIAELDHMLIDPPAADWLCRWTRLVGNGFGVGMGSLQDSFVEDGFEELMDDTCALLARLSFEARNAPGFIPRLRRYLVAVEDRLLASSPRDALPLRALLSAPALDLATTGTIIERLASRGDLAGSLGENLELARLELEAARGCTTATATRR
jgi:hypothetical protein